MRSPNRGNQPRRGAHGSLRGHGTKNDGGEKRTDIASLVGTGKLNSAAPLRRSRQWGLARIVVGLPSLKIDRAEGIRPPGRRDPDMLDPRERHDFVARLVALFDPIVRGRLYEMGKRRPVSSEKAKRVLGWTPRPITETVLDTARSLQASGLA